MKRLSNLFLGLLAAAPALLNAQGSAATGAATTAAAGAATSLPAATALTAPCPTADEARRIGEAFAKTPAPMPFAAAPSLQLPEVVVAAGMPASMGRSVDGSQFIKVWDSLAAWPEALVMIMKGGNVFEISTKIPPGEPSTKSRFFNLGKGTLSGHLRPDQLSAILGVQMPAAEGFVRGVFFYDGKGESVFGAFVGGEGGKPGAAQIAAFDRTWQLLQSLPPRCPAPTT